MKSLSLYLIALCFSLSVLADEPPCWCGFSITSENKQYRADIEFNAADSLKEPWDRKWTISVLSLSDSSVVWSSLFKHDGYGAGHLSNDGQIYVYVNDWLEMEHPNQIIIYTQNRIDQLCGTDIELSSSVYPKSISHQIWLNEYELVPNQLSDTTKLFLKTLNNQIIELDINSLTIKKKKAHSEYSGQVDLLRKLGIGLLIFMGIVIVLWTLKKLTSHNTS